MKKGEGTMIITIGLVCFVLCTVMFMQFKVVEETDITQLETMRESELREQLATWKERYEEVNAEYEENIDKINEYIDKRESNQEASELLEKELESAKLTAGLTNVIGDGIVVTLVDNVKEVENNEEEEIEDDYQVNKGKVEASDLLTLVNELRLAGAEAISINDQRIINMTDIFELNDYIILVNNGINGRVTSPYVVKAIGDQTYLESALTTKKVGYVDQHSELNITVEKQKNILIEKYKGTIELEYSTIKED